MKEMPGMSAHAICILSWGEVLSTRHTAPEESEIVYNHTTKISFITIVIGLQHYPGLASR